MTEFERTRILAYYESGMPISHIRRIMAMTVAEFDRAIKELKDNGDLPKKKTGKEKVAEAFARGERNHYEIAELYGLTPRTVIEYRGRNGIKIKRAKRNYRHCDRTNAIYEDFKSGEMTVAEIARKHDVSWTYAKKLKRKLEEDGEI